MGAYTDMSTGLRGAQHGPNAFRNSEVYGGWGIVNLPNMHVLVDPLKELTVVDYGDAPIDIMSTERSIHAIRQFVRSAVEVEYAPGKHVIPIIIGGDHSLMHPDVAALVDFYGKGNVVGFELVELNPIADPTYVSAMNANRIVRECLTGMAMRKMGLTDKHYLSPLTTTHGRKNL